MLRKITFQCVFITAILCFGHQKAWTQLLGGTYTIDSAQATGGTNFQNFTDAAAALNTGIAGPVVINVVANSGPYNEQVTLTNSINANATNTVTFNGNGNTLHHAGSSTNYATLGLDGADYITFNNLNIVADNSTNNFALHLMNNANNNSFRNCTVSTPLTGTSTNSIAVAMTGSKTSYLTQGNNGNGNLWDSCTITGGGQHAILFRAFSSASTSKDSNNNITNCIIQDFNGHGIYYLGQDSAVISNNILECPTRPSLYSTMTGIRIGSGCQNVIVERNTVRNLFGGDPTNTTTSQIYVLNIEGGAPGRENKIINNLVYNIQGSGHLRGILLTSGTNYLKVYHNTVVLDYAGATGSTNTYGIITTLSGGSVDIRNNNIYITRGGTGNKYGLSYSQNGAKTSNYNNLYINAPAGNNYIGKDCNQDHSTLNSWQAFTACAGSPFDTNSRDLNPLFVNAAGGDFTPGSGLLDNIGTYVNVNNDRYNNIRSTSTPDIGAIEFSIPPCSGIPTPGTVVAPIINVCLGGSVNLNLSGYTSTVGISFQWQSTQNISGIWTPEGAAQAVPAISVTPPLSGITYYRCVVTCPGGSNFAFSDTVQVSVPALFPGGSYTIDSSQATSGTNFRNFSDAVAAINCGIAGNIIFNVVPNSGPYNEQVTLPATIGSNAAATVTFNGNGNTLTFDPSLTQATPYTLGIDGADYVTIKNLNIVSTGGVNSYAAHLWNQANNDSFVNCSLQVPLSSGVGEVVFAAGGAANDVAAGGSGAGNNTVLSSCTLSGGSYSVAYYGVSSNTDTGNKVLNCSIKNFYQYGVYAEHEDLLVISGNTIERQDSNYVSTYYGINVNGTAKNALIEKNTLRHPFGAGGSGTAYGIYQQADAALGHENKIYNNLIYGFEGNGTQYGIYLNGSDYVRIYHNTVVLDNAGSTSGTTRGIYSTTGTGNDIKNNIISITRGGTGTKYCLYFTGGAQVSNYNNLYMNAPAGTNGIGFYGGGQPTLANWQALNSNAWDQNSYSITPLFVNLWAGNLTPTNALIDNVGTPTSVATDFYGTTRSVTTPDIGAIEFSVPPCSGTPTAGQATIVGNAIAACPGALIYLYLSGFTIGAGISIQWQQSPAGAGTWSNIANATSSAETTTFTGATDYRAVVTCANGGAFDISNTITVNVNPFYVCYCSPLTGVTLHSSIVNRITAVSILTTTLNSTTSAVGTLGYAQLNHTIASNTATIVLGLTYTLNATVSNSNQVELWIDWDQSGTFDSVEHSLLSTGTSASVSFSLPNNAVLGLTGMRLRVQSGNPGYGPNGACTNVASNGETEDYVINIVQNPLSIEILSVGAKNEGSVNNIGWSTASEASGDRFELERNIDGNFIKLADIDAKGQASTYSYWDETPVTGVNYYRIKMVDAAGGYSYSKTVSAIVRSGTFTVQAYPNPVDKVLTVKVHGEKNDDATISITDITGKLIRTIAVMADKTEVNMNGLAGGVYFIKYTDAVRTVTKRVVKE